VKGALDIGTLTKASEFTIVFDDDKGMKCRLVSADNYGILVSSAGKKLLIPKHSVKYVPL